MWYFSLTLCWALNPKKSLKPRQREKTRSSVLKLSNSMARLFRPLRRPLLCLSQSSSCSSSSSMASKILASELQDQPPSISVLNPNFYSPAQSPRTYISEMRRSAFEGNLLRLLRNEIRYELDRSPPNQVSTFIKSCKHYASDYWIRERKMKPNLICEKC